MLCGVRKMPEPMTEPITTIIADVKLSRRASVGSVVFDTSVVI
jgi:hypothetical protein